MSKQLEDENAILRNVIRETLWMARRYAHKRSTFAPTILNECIDELKKLDINIELDTAEDIEYAEDGMFGKWNPETQRFEK